MDLQLMDDGVLVIGGARGIGRAIGKAFAEEGCHVIFSDVDPEVAKVADELREGSEGRVSGLTLDAMDYEAVTKLAAEVRKYLPNLHHVVYAAGGGSGRYGFPFWNLEPSDWPDVLQVNLMGAVNVAHAFAKILQVSGHGSLLFLTSIAGQIGSQTDPPYSAAKAAVINFMQVAAKDLAPYGVRVNAIAPGMVKTDLNQSVWQAWKELQTKDDHTSYETWAGDKVRRVVPLGRWQTTEDVARMAVFLASKAAINVTGQTVNVDGGIVMHG
jgi:2-hydroxycyclohexanecarboxyl-CoA dehydrogenase